jgi:hypothetical protein
MELCNGLGFVLSFCSGFSIGSVVVVLLWGFWVLLLLSIIEQNCNCTEFESRDQIPHYRFICISLDIKECIPCMINCDKIIYVGLFGHPKICQYVDECMVSFLCNLFVLHNF